MKEKTWIINESQVLTPSMWELLRDNLNPYYQILSEGFLFSGMKPTELRRYAEHPEWRQANRIVLPDVTDKQIRRVIPLSNEGRYAMEVFDVTAQTSGIRPRSNVHQALVRAADRADGSFIPEGVNESMFRETWISWLITTTKAYDAIGSHMSCTPEDYKKITFSKKEKEKIYKYIEGW